MKNIAIKVIGIVAVFTLALGIYSPTEKNSDSIVMLMEHGNGGG
ncbi:hypothetical protein ACQKN7_10120 [Bacillus cereus]